MENSPESLTGSGFFARRDGRLQEARQSFYDAVELCREADDSEILAQALTGLGQLERDLGNYEAAIEHYRQAEDIYRRLPFPLKLAHTIRHSGDILQTMGNPGVARLAYVEVLKIYRAHPETQRLDLGNALRGYALLMAGLGESEDALELWIEARELYLQVGVQAGVDEGDRWIAKLAGK